MFLKCDSFDGDVSQWNVANGAYFPYMFCKCYSFRGDVSQWNVANGSDFDSMFGGTSVDRNNVAHWNISHAALTEWARDYPGVDIRENMFVDARF